MIFLQLYELLEAKVVVHCAESMTLRNETAVLQWFLEVQMKRRHQPPALDLRVA